MPDYDTPPDQRQLLLNPANPNQPYLILGFWVTSTSHVLTLDRRTREIRPVLELDINYASSFTPSPDGRWLAYGGPEQLFVYDTLREEVVALDTFVPLTRFQWTPDSEWLLGLGENTLAVAAPQSGDLHLKIDAQLNCTQAIWVADQE